MVFLQYCHKVDSLSVSIKSNKHIFFIILDVIHTYIIMCYFIFLLNTSEFCINILRLAVTPFSHLREKMTDANHLSCFQKTNKIL